METTGIKEIKMGYEEETEYRFIDKTGKCFDAFANTPGNDIAARWFKNGRRFSVGDMFAFRDDLMTEGFVFGKDFYVLMKAIKSGLDKS